MMMIYQTIDEVRAAGLGEWAQVTCQCGAGFELARRINSNGVHLWKLRCIGCRRDIGGAIAYERLPVEARELVPELERPDPGRKCARCGEWKLGVELHHWAPRKFFADADEWPQSWLCPECHHHWHKTMHNQREVTDGIYWDRLREQRRVKAEAEAKAREEAAMRAKEEQDRAFAELLEMKLDNIKPPDHQWVKNARGEWELQGPRRVCDWGV
jgi:hypothetical protein